MDFDKLLQILKEVNAIVSALRDMGIKIDGTINLADLLKLAK